MSNKKFYKIVSLMNQYIPETAGKLVSTLSGVEYTSDKMYLTVEVNRMNNITAFIDTDNFNAKFQTFADDINMRKAIKWLAYMAS